ncbi:MAG: metallophosphoesterase [Pseudomonadota bacterium]
MTRRGFIKGLLAFVLAGLLSALYGFFIEPAVRLRVKKWRVAHPDWPEDQPLKIVAISDLHVGEPIIDLDRVRQVVRRTNALAPDVIVLLGDYAASHRFVTEPVSMEDVAPILAELDAKLGVYAILGNHDWWDDLDAQRRGGGPNHYGELLKANGIPVLSNEALQLPGTEIWIAGLEDQLAVRGLTGRWEGLDDLPATLAQIPEDAPAILLAHEPDIFPQVPDRIALTLSGHTHGGQVRLFGWSPIVPSRYGNRYAYGHVQEEGKSLVVSGGIGCSIAPVRFGVVPEVTEISLSKA